MATAERRGAGRSSGSVSGNGAGRWRREEARVRLIYGAAASYSMAGGGIDRRRQNLAAAAGGGTSMRPKKIAAPPRIPRLLEGRFRLRARYTDGFFFYRVRVIARSLEML
jgi:hypothetical protein